MNEDLIIKLDALVGKTKIYENKKVIIKSYKFVGNTIVVFTNAHSHAFRKSEIAAFLKNLKEPLEQTIINHQISTISINSKKEINMLPESSEKMSKEIIINGYQPSAENKTLKESLMNVLKGINENPSDETLKKAKAICDVANTVVNIQKTEIQMINAVKSF